MRIEPTFETEIDEGQEEIKWNNSRHQTVSDKSHIMPEINQILTKLEQYEDRFFKIEKALNTLQRSGQQS